MHGGDWLDFAAAVLPTLLWVLLIAAVVFMLRGPIKSALTNGSLRRLKAGAGGIEAEWFEQTLNETEATVELEQEQRGSATGDEKEQRRVDGTASVESPRLEVVAQGTSKPPIDVVATISKGYRDLVTALSHRLDEVSPVSREASRARRLKLTARQLASRLYSVGAIGEGALLAVGNLENMRDQVMAGATPVDVAEAQRYASLVEDVVALLGPER